MPVYFHNAGDAIRRKVERAVADNRSVLSIAFDDVEVKVNVVAYETFCLLTVLSEVCESLCHAFLLSSLSGDAMNVAVADSECRLDDAVCVLDDHVVFDHDP